MSPLQIRKDSLPVAVLVNLEIPRRDVPVEAGGPKVISEELFLEVADFVKTSPESARRGLININTASLQVLVCLQGMTEELARAIISHRSSAGFFPNIGYLLRVPGMTREIFQQLAPKVTVRSENFRIISEGVVPSSGARKRIELIVRLTSSRDRHPLLSRKSLTL